MSELSAKQKKTILAVLRSGNLQEACDKAEISRTTLRRWFSDPEFTAELTKASDAVFREGITQFLAGQNDAIATMKRFMDPDHRPTARDAIQLRASDLWLQHLYKFRDADYADRIEKLEAEVFL